MLETEKEQCKEIAGKLESVEATMELECFRAEAKVRKQCKAREDHLFSNWKTYNIETGYRKKG